METLFNNKRFVKFCIILVAVLSLFIFAKFLSEVKSSAYIGRNPVSPSVISVSADAYVNAVPDIANITVTLSKDAVTAGDATKALNESITKTVAYLKDQKIEDRDIKSEYGGLYPKYTSTQINCLVYPCPQPEPKVTGYTSTQNITIKIRAVDNANAVKTGLSALGVTNISGPVFSIDDEEALQSIARAQAIEKAKAKAQVLARDLGVQLVGITGFSENSGGGYPIMYTKANMMDSAMGGAPAPELPKGENKVTSNVTITYEIR